MVGGAATAFAATAIIGATGGAAQALPRQRCGVVVDSYNANKFLGGLLVRREPGRLCRRFLAGLPRRARHKQRVPRGLQLTTGTQQSSFCLLYTSPSPRD